MSDAEIGIIGPPDQIRCGARGLEKWSPVFERLIVADAGQGRRRLQIASGQMLVFDLVLSRDEAAHLANLLRRSADQNGESA